MNRVGETIMIGLCIIGVVTTAIAIGGTLNRITNK
jgi:hypothetical protein